MTTVSTERIVLEPTNDRPVEFLGRIVAEVTSREHPQQQRWNELVLYAVSTGGWVLSDEGVSAVPGEKTRRKVTVCRSADEIVEALRRDGRDPRSGRAYRYLTNLALELLELVAVTDPRLAGIERQRVE